ncbi:hypothetical protein [Paeniglutamicibacter antarcticus]
MLILALFAGAIMGGLGGGLLVLFDILASSGDPDAFTGWGGPAGYAAMPIIYGTVCGMFLGLFPGAGSFIALSILDRNRPAAWGNRQAMVGGVGAAIGGILPAFFVVWIMGVELSGGLVVGAVFILVCFVIGLVVLKGILRFLDKQDSVVHNAL